MKVKNSFKVIFWVLFVLVIVILPCLFFFTLFEGFNSITNLLEEPEILIFLIIGIFTIFVLFLIGRYVFKDAKKRNLDPWMWMTIAVFVPNLLGLIIYLLVRNSHSISSKKCQNCGKIVNDDFKLCPYCGSNLNRHCPQCNYEISSDWGICPKCGKNLK